MLLSSYYDTCKAESIQNKIHDSKYFSFSSLFGIPAPNAPEALVIKNSYS